MRTDGAILPILVSMTSLTIYKNNGFAKNISLVHGALPPSPFPLLMLVTLLVVLAQSFPLC